MHRDRACSPSTRHTNQPRRDTLALAPHVQQAEAGARLVQQQHARLCQDRARDGHALLLRATARRAHRRSVQSPPALLRHRARCPPPGHVRWGAHRAHTALPPRALWGGMLATRRRQAHTPIAAACTAACRRECDNRHMHWWMQAPPLPVSQQDVEVESRCEGLPHLPARQPDPPLSDLPRPGRSPQRAPACRVCMQPGKQALLRIS